MTLYDELRAIADQSWRTQAACRETGVDPSWFWPEGNTVESVTRALAVCARCPVRAECWEEGQEQSYGVWGGAVRDRNWRRRQVAS